MRDPTREAQLNSQKRTEPKIAELSHSGRDTAYWRDATILNAKTFFAWRAKFHNFSYSLMVSGDIELWII